MWKIERREELGKTEESIGMEGNVKIKKKEE